MLKKTDAKNIVSSPEQDHPALRSLFLSTLTGRMFWLTLLFIALFFGLAELAARAPAFQAPLTPPRMGSRHYQLGHKLAFLDAMIRAKGPIDCLIIGSSMVDVGFNPDSFRKGFREITGQDIRCFNFGIDASSAASSAALARILVEDYRPRLLIFGTDARDYAVPSTDPDPAVILTTPWVRYRTGEFTLDGWLNEFSYLYRYRQHLTSLVRLQFEATLLSQTDYKFEILPNGFSPFNQVSTYINAPPDPQDDSFEVRYYTRLLTSYRVLEENISGLQNIMQLDGSGTRVLVLEMPVSDGFYYFFGNGSQDYQTFITRVEAVAALNHVPFLESEQLDLIPDDGWMDYSHLNTRGADIFSSWLGRQVGEGLLSGSLDLAQR